MALPENPITRKETYLAKIAGQEVQIPDVPITREEAYLNQIAKEGTGTKVIANPDDVAEDVLNKVEIDGEIYSIPSGGGGGSDDYLDLNNLPQVNGVELKGNKSTSDLGIKFEDLPDAPTLGTASAKNVPASGDASSSQVVMGNDSRLTDSRPASDVSSWAKQSNKPTYTASEVGLGNVPNVSTNDQTPTFTEASTRNNIASGEKLSVILGKVQKFFNDLKTVAFSGSYTDLTNTPTIPAAQVNSDWSASSGVAEILNKPSLATVATSGSYTDLTDKPNADDILMSDGETSVEDAIGEVASDLTGLVKTHTETGLTTNQYGTCNLTLPSTNYIVDAVCNNYIVIPYRSAAGNHWELVITDVSQNGAIVVQGNKTVNVTVHYI